MEKRKKIADLDVHTRRSAFEPREQYKGPGYMQERLDIIGSLRCQLLRLQDMVLRLPGFKRLSTRMIAIAFDVNYGCNGGNLAMNLCKNLALGHQEKEYSLVVCSEKHSPLIDHTDKRSHYLSSRLETGLQSRPAQER